MISLLMIGTHAAAQPAAPTPEEPEEIVVSVARLSPAKARERAVAFVQHTGIVSGKESVARWIDPVCPRAMGLEMQKARAVENRMRAVAVAANVPVAKPGCTPNISVNFVGDGAAFARTVAARDRREFGEVAADLRPKLLTGTAPIRWWYRTELRSRDGTRMVGMEPPAVMTDVGGMAGAVLPNNGESSTLTQYGSSLAGTQVARAILRATVVVDTIRAEGVTLEAVGSYAAMVAFAELQPRDTPLEGSILGLFGSEEAPRSVTKLDVTFLRELYALPLDRKARQQRQRLVRALQNQR